MRLPGQKNPTPDQATTQYSGYSYGRVTHLIRKATAFAVSFESPVSETR